MTKEELESIRQIMQEEIKPLRGEMRALQEETRTFQEETRAFQEEMRTFREESTEKFDKLETLMEYALKHIDILEQAYRAMGMER